MSRVSNLPEDTDLVNEIPLVHTDENVSEILAAEVEESDLELEEKQELLNTVSVSSKKSKLCLKLFYHNNILNLMILAF